jgi:Protein of unknwon function (DUF3008)
MKGLEKEGARILIAVDAGASQVQGLSLFDFATKLLLVHSQPLLEPAQQFFLLALGECQIVIRELGILLLQLAFDLVPVAFNFEFSHASVSRTDPSPDGRSGYFFLNSGEHLFGRHRKACQRQIRARSQERIEDMPAKSKKQQMAAGAALAAKRGEAKKSSLKGASKKMAESMSESQLKDFAKTKRKGLAKKKTSK